ncbi:hypothetical protein EHM82_01670, partial [bacterium]
MNRARNFRLALSLLLAFLAVGLGGVGVYWKVQSFQPLGFEIEASEGLGAMVTRVTDPSTGLRAGDLILLVQGADAPRPAQLAELLR